VNCSRNDCDLVYHLSCAVRLTDVSWSYEGKLICPQHVRYLFSISVVSVSVFLVIIIVVCEKSVVTSWAVLLRDFKWTVISSQKVCTPTCEVLVGNPLE